MFEGGRLLSSWLVNLRSSGSPSSPTAALALAIFRSDSPRRVTTAPRRLQPSLRARTARDGAPLLAHLLHHTPAAMLTTRLDLKPLAGGSACPQA